MLKRLAPILAVAVLAAACARPEQPAASTSASPAAGSNTERGKALASQYGCNVCHAIPAVAGPAGSLGPSLAQFATRPTFSNGTVQTTHANLTKYLIEPASVNPQPSMPAVGVNAADAGDIAAYLLTLK
ncbi:MAG TPA: cytochrome c [Thermoanaerobaculia bacterium]|nr:cytochrome c [Thermoanaerobaculia bacterium]